MTRWHIASVALVLLAGALAAPGDLIWDNFLSPPNGYDGQSFFSSEVSAAIPSSWAGDDAYFGQPVIVQGIEWLAIRKPGYTYTAEAIILDGGFNTLHYFPGLSYSAVIDPNNPLFGYQSYKGFVELPDVNLASGHYYFAVRLVSGTPENPAGGRNFLLTTGSGMPNPAHPALTMGVVQVPSFGYPDWTLIGNYESSPVTDYSYRIYGEVIPEPVGLAMLAAAVFFARRR